MLTLKKMSSADEYMQREFIKASGREGIFEQGQQLAGSILEAPNVFEQCRRDVAAQFDGLFAGTWSQDCVGLCLTTAVSEAMGATSGPRPNTLCVHVDDSKFNSDPAVYDGQLSAAFIRELAAILVGHDSRQAPTAKFLAVCAELTLAAKSRLGHVSARMVLASEQFGLSPFTAYIEAARGVFDDGSWNWSDLEKFVNAAIPGQLLELFEADQGPLKLADDADLRAGLTDEELNAIGEIEITTGADERQAGIDRILARAASRLQGVR